MTPFEFEHLTRPLMTVAELNGSRVYIFYYDAKLDEGRECLTTHIDAEDAKSLIRLLIRRFRISLFGLLRLGLMKSLTPYREELREAN